LEPIENTKNPIINIPTANGGMASVIHNPIAINNKNKV
jgi:hypothetical protein